MKLLLVAPRWPENSLWGQIYFRFPYLGLTTLAALTGEEWDISIIDENVTSLDSAPEADLVGITLMTPLAGRGYAIADRFREKGIPVVLGGIHPTMMEEEARSHADSIVLGEAEGVWPQVLADFKENRLRPFYRSGEHRDLADLPFPRRDLLDRKAYFFINTLQTTRGCPFDCEFCSVTSFYGRTYRIRPVQDVLDEMAGMERGFVFFVDDNIVGNPSYAKELFRALIPLRIKWFSQASLSIVRDPELLRLAGESGCKGLFIGFESLSQENLKAIGKSMNRAAEYRDAVRKIHDHGIGIQGSFIFGADEDDKSVFSDVLRFIERTHIEAALFSVLTPFPGTRIREWLRAQNRIIHNDWEKYDMNHVVFKPRKMNPEELQAGLEWAYRKLYGYSSILKRLFPFNRNALFFGIQNLGFRKAWEKVLKGET
ncbi:MAG: B12-binding domain-containing radical SAM protein [Deltaproteobacteria bacterium]|nr:B12-binding domain-containing radical SAM protein [Deltaproteobacteria bacterium]MBW2130688.1 B12-binding domain-containing radical SAM protein [Deltaproteobacteria bacterium]